MDWEGQGGRRPLIPEDKNNMGTDKTRPSGKHSGGTITKLFDHNETAFTASSHGECFFVEQK
jgi:hypothetical protein